MIVLSILKVGLWLRGIGEKIEIFAVRRMPKRHQIFYIKTVWTDRAESWGRVSDCIRKELP